MIVITTHFIDSYGLQAVIATTPSVVIQQVMIPQTPGVVTYDQPYYTYYQTYYDNYRRYANRMQQIYPYLHVEVPADQYPFMEQSNRLENYDYDRYQCFPVL